MTDEIKRKISKDMTFGELLQAYPDTAQVLSGYGLHCVGCRIGVTETIEQGARAHGLNENKIASMMEELNAAAV